MQKHKVVDFFPFFAKLDKEKLELRYHMLKDHVDFFVVAEANRSHSGIPLERELRKTLHDLMIPEDRFVVVDVDIPDDVMSCVEEIDYQNCYEGNYVNINGVQARCRDRLIKDSLLQVFDNFDDATVFIHSDSDEIINPTHVKWVAELARNYQMTHVLKIPLVNLQGKATLRVHHSSDQSPQMWDRSMFFCTKYHLKNATPTNIRSNINNPFQISYVEIDGKRVEDMGWHLSWMGDSSHRFVKMTHYAHYDDTLSGLIGESYKSNDMEEHMKSEPSTGNIPPSGEKTLILKAYDSSLLPKEIFLNSRLRNFFVGKNYPQESALKQLLHLYSFSTSDPNIMFDLAREYEKMGQTAIALSFYLRAAEYYAEKEKSYECIVRMGICFYAQKNRDFSTNGRFYHAAALMPERPEAYYMLSKLNMEKHNWVDSLMYTNLCISSYQRVGELLSSFDGVFNLHDLLYNRAVCLYEMGNIKESNEEFDNILTRNDISENLVERVLSFKRSHPYLS